MGWLYVGICAIQKLRNPVATPLRHRRREYSLSPYTQRPASHRQPIWELSFQAERALQRKSSLWLRIPSGHFFADPASRPLRASRPARRQILAVSKMEAEFVRRIVERYRP